MTAPNGDELVKCTKNLGFIRSFQENLFCYSQPLPTKIGENDSVLMSGLLVDFEGVFFFCFLFMLLDFGGRFYNKGSNPVKCRSEVHF